MSEIRTMYTVRLDESHTFRTLDAETAEELSQEGHVVTAATYQRPEP